mgnify:CR=1 FL=1
MSYTSDQRRKLAKTNLEAAFKHLEYLIDYPEKFKLIPNEAIVNVLTDDGWVNQQNNKIVANWAEVENRSIYEVKLD